MKRMNPILILLTVALFGASSVQANRATTADPDPELRKSKKIKPDNTSLNQRDRKETELTADNQPMNENDVDITARIRQRLVDDDALSTYSQNIKIVTQGGVVTLKGPVRSQAEKDQIASIAKQIAGRNAVFNELEIAR